MATSELLSRHDPHRGSLLQVKNLTSKAKARTLEAFFGTTAQALCAVSAGDARDYFEHCGYVKPQDQPFVLEVASAARADPEPWFLVRPRLTMTNSPEQ